MPVSKSGLLKITVNAAKGLSLPDGGESFSYESIQEGRWDGRENGRRCRTELPELARRNRWELRREDGSGLVLKEVVT